MPRPTKAPSTHTLLVCLHGVGSSRQDVKSLAQALTQTLRPGVKLLIPDAPEPFDLGPSGRQWFSLDGVTEANRLERVKGAMPPLEAMIDAELNRLNLDRRALILVGFSQGAIMAMSWAALGLSCRAVLAYAGRLPVGLDPLPHPAAMLLIHGEHDRVIPFDHGVYAQRAFTSRGVTATLLKLPIGHTISPDGISAGRDFLHHVLGDA